MESTELAKMVHQAKGNQEVLQLLIEKFQPLINSEVVAEQTFFAYIQIVLKSKDVGLILGARRKFFRIQKCYGHPEQIFQI